MPQSTRPARLGRMGVAALAAFAVFAVTSVLATSGLTHRFDTQGLMLFRAAAGAAEPIGSAWLQETARDFTALGSNGVLAVLAGNVVGYLALTGRRRDAACLLATFVLVLLLVIAAKFGFGRPRPDVGLHAARVFTMSFPSSHATLSAAMGTALVMLLRRGGTRDGTLGVTRGIGLGFAAAAATFIVGLVGLSRVYLGVHWPSDVLAGWSLGLAGALSCQAAFDTWSARRPAPLPAPLP